MKALKYRKQVTKLDATWTFTNPIESATYDPSIKSSTADVTKAYNQALQQLKWDFYLVIEDVWKEKISKAYRRSCLEEIEKMC